MPEIFARCLRVLGRLPAPPPIIPDEGGPRARGRMLESSSSVAETQRRQLAMRALWLEFQQWSASAQQYASAIACWADAADIAGNPAWPPTAATVDAMATMCRRRPPPAPELALRCIYCACIRNPSSLASYLSHVRSALLLVRGDLGALVDTNGLVLGVPARMAATSAGAPDRTRADGRHTKQWRQMEAASSRVLLLRRRDGARGFRQ